MKVAPAVAEVLGVVDDAAGSHTEGYGEVLSVAHAPVAAPARPAKEEATAPQPAEMEPGREMPPVTVQPCAGGARGSIEFLGRWNEKEDDRAMPIKHTAERNRETMVRVALGKLVDELVQTNASSGILAISNWKEKRGPHEVTVSEGSWSASPDDTSYQRHGSVDEVGRLIAASRLRDAHAEIRQRPRDECVRRLRLGR